MERDGAGRGSYPVTRTVPATILTPAAREENRRTIERREHFNWVEAKRLPKAQAWQPLEDIAVGEAQR